jgi:hypothetical protein
VHVRRRIKLQATGAGFTLRPSFVMPSMLARTDTVETALSLRQWGVPFDALASVFGHDARCWYRAWLAFGHPSLVGTTVTAPQNLPRDLGADEQRTRVAKQQVYVPTTVGGGCFLGGSVGRRPLRGPWKQAMASVLGKPGRWCQIIRRAW